MTNGEQINRPALHTHVFKSKVPAKMTAEGARVGSWPTRRAGARRRAEIKNFGADQPARLAYSCVQIKGASEDDSRGSQGRKLAYTKGRCAETCRNQEFRC